MRLTQKQIMAQEKEIDITEAQIPSLEVLRNLRGALNTHQYNTQLEKFRVVSKCEYCGKKRTYSLLSGDRNHGACSKAKCILSAMRDTL